MSVSLLMSAEFNLSAMRYLALSGRGGEARCEQHLAILPSGPGTYVLRVRVLANEISPPILVEHALEVIAKVQQVDLEELEAVLFKEYMEDEEEG